MSRAMVAAAVATLAHFPSSAGAHNWLHTPGRARKEASTLKPCRGRKASDTHAQIGPGQKVVMKWATGHTRDTYIVVVKGEDAGWLRDGKFQDYLNDYVLTAPAGSNTAIGSGAHRRNHGTKVTSGTPFVNCCICSKGCVYVQNFGGKIHNVLMFTSSFPLCFPYIFFSS